jgi:hypothetical protein
MNGQTSSADSIPEEHAAGDLPLPKNLRSIGECTSGLNIDRVNPNSPKASEIIQYLKTLNFDVGKQIDNKWDCTERALWGIVHARRKFPGSPIGMAEGIAQIPAIKGQHHAVIIVWEKDGKSFIYWDPLLPNKDDGSYPFDPNPNRIIAFPFGSDDQKDIFPPMRNNMARIRDNNYVQMETNYTLYPLKTQDRTGVLDYLLKEEYEYCADHHPDKEKEKKDRNFKEYWRDRDRAFWAYMHVRQKYLGCAIGVAFGDPAKDHSVLVNVIWYKEGTKILYKYIDPAPEFKLENDKDVTNSFKPRMMFF